MTKQQFPPFEPVKIDKKFWAIEQGGVRCYLFEGEDMALLVDAGFGGDLKSVCEKLTDKPIQLLITHADGDHMGAAWQFGSYYMHPSEFSYYEMRNSKQPDAIPIWEGEIIDIGGWKFEIVFIPGHTPGSIALLEKEKRFILTGDTVGNVPIYMFGNGRNLPAYLASIKKLKEIQDSFDEIWPAHGKRPLPTAILKDLCVLAGEITTGKWPQPQPAPAHMPEDVKVYSNGKVSFYLKK